MASAWLADIVVTPPLRGNETHLGLEAGMEGGEEGVLPGQSQNPLFGQSALHVVILDNDILPQHLYCKHPVCPTEFC